QRGEVDDRAGPHRFDDLHHRLAVRDVAGAPGDLAEVLLVEKQPRPAPVLGEIEGDGRYARARKQREHPAADAAARASDEHRPGKARPVDLEAFHQAHFFLFRFGPCATTFARVGSPPSSARTKVPPWYFSVRGSAPDKVFARTSSA